MIDTITGVLADVPVEHRESAEANLLTFAAEAGHKQVAALGAGVPLNFTVFGTPGAVVALRIEGARPECRAPSAHIDIR